MHFTSPIWLASLAPWVGVSLWLLWGRRDRTNVPFLNLWRGSVQTPRAARQLTLPPHLLSGIVAMLLGVLACAGPVVRKDAHSQLAATTSPAKPPANVSIVHVAARDRPRLQVMVTVRNESDSSTATLNVQSQRQKISLPARGMTRNYFVDVSVQPERIDVALDVADEIESDNHATLTRRQPFPKVEVRSDVAPEVRRVVEAYSRARPTQEGGNIVAVASNAIDDAGVIVATGSADGTASDGISVAAHPVTEAIDFESIHPRSIDVKPLGEGWKAVVSVAGRPVVAVRESPVRQVWIGYEAPGFASTPAFVMLWTNLLDWTGGGGDDAYVASLPPAPVPARASALTQPIRGHLALAPWMLVCSLLCLFLMTVLWPDGPNLTGFSTPRTV